MQQSASLLRADVAHPLAHYPETAPGRAAVEQFIQAVYAKHFGAQVQIFAPMLVGLHSPSGELIAAAGYRPAESGSLFLERYLNGPVQQALFGPSATVEERRAIVEVGHLAANRPGQGRALIAALIPHLLEGGFDWVVSTMTQELRHLFVRMGIAPLALGFADPSRLGASASQWGSYYEHAPIVLAGQLSVAGRNLRISGDAA